jgi:hypothetical protein
VSEPETLAYILLKCLYVFGIVCGLTPPLLLIAVLLDEWRRAKNANNDARRIAANIAKVPELLRKT